MNNLTRQEKDLILSILNIVDLSMLRLHSEEPESSLAYLDNGNIKLNFSQEEINAIKSGIKKLTDCDNSNERTFNDLVNTWKRAYKITLPSKLAKMKRINDLETWDKAGSENERKAKIQALKELIN